MLNSMTTKSRQSLWMVGSGGLVFVVTIVELKDFIGSRLDELVYFLSKGLRFTLTSVLGQFIGLVWRGIREGLKK